MEHEALRDVPATSELVVRIDNRESRRPEQGIRYPPVRCGMNGSHLDSAALPGEKDGAARSGARTRPPNTFDSAIFSLVCA